MYMNYYTIDLNFMLEMMMTQKLYIGMRYMELSNIKHLKAKFGNE